MSRIAVIGAGAWGTGLAIVLGRGGRHQVRLWVHEKEVRDSILARRENELFLPGQSIPPTVSPTGSLQEALESAEIVVSVMPSQHCRPLVPADGAVPQARRCFLSAPPKDWRRTRCCG